MRTARIIVGANLGDEGKGTVVAHYAKNAKGSVLNILTNGGAQRGHSILTNDGSITYKHFGSGTYYGADTYYSCYYILNPMQFVKEYNELIVKPKNVYRDKQCRWTTPYDSLANLIMENLQHRKASCCFGIWNTIKRYSVMKTLSFDEFVNSENPYEYLRLVKEYYEKIITIPDEYKNIWNNPVMQIHFINDCKFMYNNTIVVGLNELTHDNLLFENGQGLMLCDKGIDSFDTTPSNTGIEYSLELLKNITDVNVTAHYVTRPYLTRHGDGYIYHEGSRKTLSESVKEDRTNTYNEFQGNFRYGLLDIETLKNRISEDNKKNIKYEIDLTHCDEMDRVNEFKNYFEKINIYDSALII